MAYIARNTYQAALNGENFIYSGNVVLDFGYDVLQSFPLPVTPYEQLKDLSTEDRLAYIDGLAMAAVSEKQDYINSLQAMVDSGAYRASENPVSNLPPVDLAPTIDKLREVMVKRMSEICNDKIVNHFYSDCLGESLRFDCNNSNTQPDQANIMGNSVKAMAILAGMAMDNVIRYKNSGIAQCFDFTPMQAIQLGMDMYTHITTHVERFQALRIYITDPARTLDEIRAVSWETEVAVPA
jgi:hypothetical protein